MRLLSITPRNVLAEEKEEATAITVEAKAMIKARVHKERAVAGKIVVGTNATILPKQTGRHNIARIDINPAHTESPTEENHILYTEGEKRTHLEMCPHSF